MNFLGQEIEYEKEAIADVPRMKDFKVNCKIFSIVYKYMDYSATGIEFIGVGHAQSQVWMKFSH